MIEHHDALRLCDEIGACPQAEVHLMLNDEVPFFVCPYVIKGGQKLVIEKEMNWLEKLGIFRKDIQGTVS